MRNELSTQAVNMAVVPQTATPAYNNSGMNNQAAASLFNAGMNGKNYANDFMMPDWLKTGNITEEQSASIFNPSYQAQIPDIQNTQNPVQPYTKDYIQQCYDEILAQNPNIRITPKGNLYEVSNIAKKTGMLAGLFTGLGGGIVKVFKGEALSKAFNLKSLAVKLPVLTIAGWAAGAVIDAFVNSSKAKQADSAV